MESDRKFHGSFLNPSILISTMLAAALALCSVGMFSVSAFAGEHVIYNFMGGSDGILPNDLIADRTGNLYGTTFNGGGSAGAGTVFELSPPAQMGGAWTETVLFSFSYDRSIDGVGPIGGLVMDPAGNLYGTTWLDGAQGAGVAFELSPPAVKGGAWTYSVLHAFGGSDLSSPEARLTLDAAGNLYGTTASGGSGGCAGGCGGIFELSRPVQKGGTWTETVLFNFTGAFESGGGTSGGLTLYNGALYGTTYSGSDGPSGTVFRLRRSGKHWVHQVLYAFGGDTDGSSPQREVVFDNNGNLYGTTQYGGSDDANCFGSGCGTVFQLTPTLNGPWKHAVLYAFSGGSNGGLPERPVTLDEAGNLYGSTSVGGDLDCAVGSGAGCGTVFQLAPPTVQGAWTETVLHSFLGGTDGSGPGGVIFSTRGLLYGPAVVGGTHNDGLVFSITP